MQMLKSRIPDRLVQMALMIVLLASPAAAQVAGFDFGFDDSDSPSEVTVSLKASSTNVRPGSDLVVAVILDMADGWHVWPKPGPVDGDYVVMDGTNRTTIAIPEGQAGALTVHPGFAEWPELHGVKANLGEGEKTYAVYEGRAVIRVPVTVAADATPGEYSFGLVVDYQACDDTQCLMPETVQPEVVINILAANTPDLPPTDSEAQTDNSDFTGFDAGVFARIRGGAKASELLELDAFGLKFTLDVGSGSGFLLLLLVAALGGALLNFTPCVLPVIPLKIMGLSSAAGNRKRCFLLGLTMSLGVVAFWMALAVLIAAFTSFGAINQLFQYPAFTISVGVIIVVMAIGMAGFFTIKLPSKVYSIETSHDTMVGSFLFGIMTAVLSTPCTAPLMGAAAAWATTQNPVTVLAVFAAIGSGMAIPYLFLSAFPGLVQKMPRTGPASEVVKQVMGLLLLAAGIYFIGSGLSGMMVTAPEPPSRMYWWFIALAGIAAGGLLAWRTFKLSRKPAILGVFGGLGVLLVAISVYLGFQMTASGPIKWAYYTDERFATAIENEQVVVLDFTAEWCLNCKLLESTVLESDEVVALSRLDEVVFMKVDITGDNPEGSAKLKAEDRITIPLLVIYGKDGAPVLKSDFYTSDQVVEAIEEAAGTLGQQLSIEPSMSSSDDA